MKVSKYLEIFRTLSYPSLFSGKCLDALKNIQNKYGELDSSHVLYEIVLNKSVFTADFSCRLYDEILKYYWLEFDFEIYSSLKNIAPCVFLEAVSNKSFPIDDEQKMHKFFGREKFETVKQNLIDLTKLLEDNGTRLLNLGNLDCRGKENFESVRVETRVRTSRRVIEILKALSYSGDLSLIEKTLSAIEPYALRNSFTVAFELFPDRISDKIGVYFFPFTAVKDTRELMKFLVEKNFCLSEKADEIIKWRRDKIPEGLFIQDIHHFKIGFDKNKILSFKTYLHHSGTFLPFLQSRQIINNKKFSQNS